MSWKDKTCDTCEYKVEQWCRKYPQRVRVVVPKLRGPGYIFETLPACAEYKNIRQVMNKDLKEFLEGELKWYEGRK